MAEYWDIYDENRVPAGRLHKRGVKLKAGDYHVICEVWLVCDDKLLITRRHPSKNWGGLWECTGGAVIAGEDSLQAIKREIHEEIGIEVDDSELEFKGSVQGNVVFVDCYQLHKQVSLSDLTLQKEEVTDAKFVTYDEFMDLHRRRCLIPYMYGCMRTLGLDFVSPRRFKRRRRRR